MSYEGEYYLKRFGVYYLHLLIFLYKPAIYASFKGQTKILCQRFRFQSIPISFATMSHEIPSIEWNQLSKAEKYQFLHSNWNALIDNHVDEIANLANGAALMKDIFGWWWVGFYRVMNEELVLGPFQGPVACTRIEKGKGVCGASWIESKTLVVPNVDEFPGHIACSSKSKSEIVVPIYKRTGEIWGVLDVDSEYLDDFNEVDQIELEKFCRSLEIILS